MAAWTGHEGAGDAGTEPPEILWGDMSPDGHHRATGATATGCVMLWAWGIGRRTVIFEPDDFFADAVEVCDLLVSFGRLLSAPPCGCSSHHIEHESSSHCDGCSFVEDGGDEATWRGVTLDDVMCHLEEAHSWSREGIADWLDGLSRKDVCRIGQRMRAS